MPMLLKDNHFNQSKMTSNKRENSQRHPQYDHDGLTATLRTYTEMNWSWNECEWVEACV